MPVEVNANITGICTANEIRPQPKDFYWMFGNTRIQGLSYSNVVNSTYNVVSVYSTISLDAFACDDGRILTCILVMENGEELRRMLQIDVDGVDFPVEETGVYILGFLQDGSWISP